MTKNRAIKVIFAVMLGVMLTGCSGEDETEESSEEVTEEDTNEEDESVLSDEDVNNLEEGLTTMLTEEFNNMSVYSFKYENNRITAMVDMQKDPLPTKEGVEDILAGVTWYLAELNEVVDTSNFRVTAILVSSVGDENEMIHWLTERWDPLTREYEMTEQEAYNTLYD